MCCVFIALTAVKGIKFHNEYNQEYDQVDKPEVKTSVSPYALSAQALGDVKQTNSFPQHEYASIGPATVRVYLFN